jgi:hypothetical protein
VRGPLHQETLIADLPAHKQVWEATVQRIFLFPDQEPGPIHPEKEFLVIFQGKDPRWIVPNRSRAALPVFQSWRPYGTKTRVQWAGVVAACRWNALVLLPGIKKTRAQCNLAYWAEHIQNVHSGWDILGHIGNPSPTQKAILFFLDRHSIPAVAKIPLTEAAATAILNEAAVLRRMRKKHIVPEVVFEDPERGIAAQSWVVGQPAARRFGEEHLDFLLRLSCEGHSARLSMYRDGMIALLQKLPWQKLEWQQIEAAVSLLDNEEDLPAFTEHRDFAPWNIRRLSDGSITLIDWEWAIEHGLPWLDVCRYFYIQDYLFQESKNVWELLKSHPLLRKYASGCGLSARAIRGLTAYYLLRSLHEDVNSGEKERAQYIFRQVQSLLQQK